MTSGALGFSPPTGKRGSRGSGTRQRIARALRRSGELAHKDNWSSLRHRQREVLSGRTIDYGYFPKSTEMYDGETKVSAQHARIYRQGAQFLMRFGSVNGTIINSVTRRIDPLNAKAPRVLSAAMK